jgi:hypothetical protein
MTSSPSARDGAAHSLVFRVMRLCRPALQVDFPLRIHPGDLIGESDILPPQSSTIPDGSFTGRSELRSSMDAFGVTGMLVLPQTFGSIYLGETFCSYISVSNSSVHEVTQVVVKAELQTERQRVTLADNTHSPMVTLKAGGRYDFIIEHDIKELGAHTLICSATYTDPDGDRKHLPQYFKFLASNPLSVRTKVGCLRRHAIPCSLLALLQGHTQRCPLRCLQRLQDEDLFLQAQKPVRSNFSWPLESDLQ